ncbi:CHAP domain-containing protein, partial [Microcoleus sp. herbarium12]|uniref:CHAP domain-containing protein n=1 Tax=Microcoleus sp. herbarium12 TaxID=3055437 RepID=UPI002FD69ED9
QVPINSNSANYRNGSVNPFAYNWQGQCTWYAYGRMLETGLLPAAIKNNALFRGNAGAWRNDALKVGLPITSTPTAGARGLVVWPPNTQYAGSVGHVAFLEEVYPDGRVRITEANWPTGSGIKERILTPAQYAGLSFVRLENAQTNSYNAPPATPGKQRQYIVRSGDTLSGIAKRELGDANRWREIQKVGGGTFTEAEALNLQVGQSVYLPVGYQVPTVTPVTPVTNNRPQPVSGKLPNWQGGDRQAAIQAIVNEANRQGITSKSQIAYILATVQHETNNSFQPVREAYYLGEPNAENYRRQNLSYYPFYGRGYVQLTWKSNYQKYSDLLGIDLVNNPDLVLRPDIALFILVDGMKRGTFTTAKLDDYISGNRVDFLNARRIVNGIDEAEKIKQYAINWQSQLA